MPSRKREKIYKSYLEWQLPENKMEPGELYTFSPLMEGKFGVENRTQRYTPIDGDNAVPFTADWSRNSEINPYIAKIFQISPYLVRRTNVQGEQDYLGYFIHHQHRYMKMSAQFEQFTQQIKRIQQKHEVISGVFGSVAIWMKYDKYVFIPSTFMVYSKITHRHMFVNMNGSSSFLPACYPWLDRLALSPKNAND